MFQRPQKDGSFFNNTERFEIKRRELQPAAKRRKITTAPPSTSGTSLANISSPSGDLFSTSLVSTPTFTSFFGMSWTTDSDTHCRHFLLEYQQGIVGDYMARFPPVQDRIFFAEWAKSQERPTSTLRHFVSSSDMIGRSALASSLGISHHSSSSSSNSSAASSSSSSNATRHQHYGSNFSPSSTTTSPHHHDFYGANSPPTTPSWTDHMMLDQEMANDGISSPMSCSSLGEQRQHNILGSSSFANFRSSYGIPSLVINERSLPPVPTHTLSQPQYLADFQKVRSNHLLSHLSINECSRMDTHKMFWDLDLYTTSPTLSPDDLCVLGIICRVVQLTVRNFFVKIDPDVWTRDGAMACRRTDPRRIHNTPVDDAELQRITQESFGRLADIYASTPKTVGMRDRLPPQATLAANAQVAGNGDAVSVASSGNISLSSISSTTSRPLSGFGSPPLSRAASSSSPSQPAPPAPMVPQPNQALSSSFSANENAMSDFCTEHFVLNTIMEADRNARISDSSAQAATSAARPKAPSIFVRSGGAHVESPAVVDSFSKHKSVYKVGLNCHLPALPCDKLMFESMRHAVADAMVRVLATNSALVKSSSILMHSKDPNCLEEDSSHIKRIAYWLDVCDPTPINNGQCRLIFSRKSSPCVRCSNARQNVGKKRPLHAQQNGGGGQPACRYCSGTGMCDAGPDAVSMPFIHVNGRGGNLASMDMVSCDSMVESSTSRALKQQPVSCHIQAVFDDDEVRSLYEANGWDLSSAKRDLTLSSPTPHMVRFLPRSFVEKSKVFKMVGEWIALTSIRIPTDVAAAGLSAPGASPRHHMGDFWLPKNYCWCHVYSAKLVYHSLGSSFAKQTPPPPSFADDEFGCTREKHDALFKAKISKRATKFLENVLANGSASIRTARTTNTVLDLARDSGVFADIVALMSSVQLAPRNDLAPPSLGGVLLGTRAPGVPRIWPISTKDIFTARLRSNFSAIYKRTRMRDVMGVLSDNIVTNDLCKYNGAFVQVTIGHLAESARRSCLCKWSVTNGALSVHSSSSIVIVITPRHVVQICQSSKCSGLCAVIGTVRDGYADVVFSRAAEDALAKASCRY